MRLEEPRLRTPADVLIASKSVSALTCHRCEISPAACLVVLETIDPAESLRLDPSGSFRMPQLTVEASWVPFRLLDAQRLSL